MGRNVSKAVTTNMMERQKENLFEWVELQPPSGPLILANIDKAQKGPIY